LENRFIDYTLTSNCDEEPPFFEKVINPLKNKNIPKNNKIIKIKV